MKHFPLDIESDGEGSRPGLVPELQEHGVYRTEYMSTTLRVTWDFVNR